METHLRLCRHGSQEDDFRSVGSHIIVRFEVFWVRIDDGGGNPFRGAAGSGFQVKHQPRVKLKEDDLRFKEFKSTPLC
jgi:hypothetical protein